MQRERVEGTYTVAPQRLAVLLAGGRGAGAVKVGGAVTRNVDASGLVEVTLPAAPGKNPCTFEISPVRH